MNGVSTFLPVVSQWRKQARLGSAEAQQNIAAWEQKKLSPGEEFRTIDYVVHKISSYHLKLFLELGKPAYKTKVLSAFTKLNRLLPGLGEMLDQHHLNAIGYRVHSTFLVPYFKKHLELISRRASGLLDDMGQGRTKYKSSGWVEHKADGLGKVVFKADMYKGIWVNGSLKRPQEKA